MKPSETDGQSQQEAKNNLRPREAAEYVGLSESKMAKLRMRINGLSRFDIEDAIERFRKAGESSGAQND